MRLIGTASERQHTHPPARADELAGIELPDQDGVEHRLGDYWKDAPAVLVWLRHYG
jgi:hypothetical protein